MLRQASVRVAIAAVIGASAVAAVPAQAEETYVDVLVNFMVSPDDSNRIPEIDSGIGIDVRYGGWKQLWDLPLELRAFYDELDAKGSGAPDLFQAGVGADLLYPLGDRIGTVWGISPFALAGVGASYSDAVPGLDEEFGLLANLGAGLLWNPSEDSAWRLRGELRYVYQSLEDGYFDLNALIGVEIPMGKTMAAKEEPVRVVKTERVRKDTDGDGVMDDVDACPDTPAGVNVDASGCEPAEIITLKDVQFALDSDVLSDRAMEKLDEAAVALVEKYAGKRIEVAGHTDTSGEDDYNRGLSRRRAEAVRGYLIERGVEADSLTAIGYGPSQPVADNDTYEGRAKNRRVELRVRK